jgi:hypothetical protein
MMFRCALRLYVAHIKRGIKKNGAVSLGVWYTYRSRKPRHWENVVALNFARAYVVQHGKEKEYLRRRAEFLQQLLKEQHEAMQKGDSNVDECEERRDMIEALIAEIESDPRCIRTGDLENETSRVGKKEGEQ